MNLPEDGPKGKMGEVLAAIVAQAEGGARELRPRRSALERAALARRPAPSFGGSLRGETLGLIAEVKRRSPSAGVIAGGLDPVAHATTYEGAGASAISVLTEQAHFGGSLDDLSGVTGAVRVPVLRKDFIVDETQLLEARGAGAAAALLIVRILSPRRLRELLAFSAEIGLGVLTEAHDEAEIDVALEGGAEIIGVNSRDLSTFAVDAERAWKLFTKVPRDRVVVAESGITTIDEARSAADAGADAILVGTALSSVADPAPLVRRFRGLVPRAR